MNCNVIALLSSIDSAFYIFYARIVSFCFGSGA